MRVDFHLEGKDEKLLDFMIVLSYDQTSFLRMERRRMINETSGLSALGEKIRWVRW